VRQDAPHYFRVCVCVTEPAVPLLALNLECKHYFRLHAEVSHPAQTLSPIYHRKVSSRVSKGRKAKKLKKHWLFYGSTPALQIAQAYPANIRVKTTVQYRTAQVTFNGTSSLSFDTPTHFRIVGFDISSFHFVNVSPRSGASFPRAQYLPHRPPPLPIAPSEISSGCAPPL